MIRLMALALLIPAAAVAQSANDLTSARAEITPLLTEMQTAANAHDTDRHLAFYAHDSSLIFILNDQQITGWDALRAQQRQWWNNGKSDVAYTSVGAPEFTMLAPGLVMVTHFITSRRTIPGGKTRVGKAGISALWQKRPEGWRIIYAHESSVQQ